ncbi:MAG: hypothetical protein ACXWPS_08090 [Ktedonobacteraceae bacterium]
MLKTFKSLHPTVQIVFLIGVFGLLIVIATNQSAGQNLTVFISFVCGLLAGMNTQHP